MFQNLHKILSKMMINKFLKNELNSAHRQVNREKKLIILNDRKLLKKKQTVDKNFNKGFLTIRPLYQTARINF